MMTNLDAFYSGNSFSKVFNNIIIIIILLHGKYESVGKMKKIILLFSFREKKGRSGPINYSSNWCRLSRKYHVHEFWVTEIFLFDIKLKNREQYYLITENRQLSFDRKNQMHEFWSVHTKIRTISDQ